MKNEYYDPGYLSYVYIIKMQGCGTEDLYDVFSDTFLFLVLGPELYSMIFQYSFLFGQKQTGIDLVRERRGIVAMSKQHGSPRGIICKEYI